MSVLVVQADINVAEVTVRGAVIRQLAAADPASVELKVAEPVYWVKYSEYTQISLKCMGYWSPLDTTNFVPNIVSVLHLYQPLLITVGKTKP